MTFASFFLAHLLIFSQSPVTSPPPFSDGQVVASHAAPLCENGAHGASSCREVLHIELLLGSERLYLLSDTSWRLKIDYDLLPLGVYKVRIVKDERPTPYMRHSRYELKYPDGKLEQFELEGIANQGGPAPQ